MLLFENCRELCFQANSAKLRPVNYAKWIKSPKISGSCKGNVLNHFLFCFDDKKVDTKCSYMWKEKGRVALGMQQGGQERKGSRKYV